MKCLQPDCTKDAHEIEAVAGYQLRECEDGHRTGEMPEKIKRAPKKAA